MNKTQLALLVSYLNARKRTAQMESIQMDGGRDRVYEALREENEALKALVAACPDATP